MDIQLFNTSIDGHNKLPICLDVLFPVKTFNHTLIIFCHGFKGFKDWGSFNFVSNEFAQKGFVFLKFNFSHNGTSLGQKSDFVNMDAFSMNNYSIELEDLDFVLNWVEQSFENLFGKSYNSLILMGHSRGGGISILKAATDSRINKLITWSAVSDFEKRFNAYPLLDWKKDNVIFIPNSRTNQQMPLHYQFYENFMMHKNSLNILESATRIRIPWLIVHAKDDEVVLPDEAELLHKTNALSKLKWIDHGGHTFGAKHPFDNDKISEFLVEAIKSSINFSYINKL